MRSRPLELQRERRLTLLVVRPAGNIISSTCNLGDLASGGPNPILDTICACSTGSSPSSDQALGSVPAAARLRSASSTRRASWLPLKRAPALSSQFLVAGPCRAPTSGNQWSKPNFPISTRTLLNFIFLRLGTSELSSLYAYVEPRHCDQSIIISNRHFVIHAQSHFLKFSSFGFRSRTFSIHPQEAANLGTILTFSHIYRVELQQAPTRSNGTCSYLRRQRQYQQARAGWRGFRTSRDSRRRHPERACVPTESQHQAIRAHSV